MRTPRGATGPYPEPDESSPQLSTYFPKIHCNIMLHLRLCLSSGFSLHDFRPNFSMHFHVPIRATCRADLILLDFVTLVMF